MSKSDVRDRLVDKGLELFATQGYHATGVKEIVDSVAVPKGSFYAYFPSKDAFGCEVVDRYWLGSQGSIARLTAGTGSARERLQTHFRDLAMAIVTADYAAGCLLGRFGSEVASRSPSIRERLSHAFREWNRAIAVVTQQAADEGDLVPGCDPLLAANFLLNSWEGAVVRALTERSDEPMTTFISVAFGSMFIGPSDSEE